MKKFIELDGWCKHICVDREEIQSFSTYDEVNDKCPYKLRIFLRDKKEPDIHSFDSEKDRDSFYEKLQDIVYANYYEKWSYQSFTRIEECFSHIKNEISKINKKLFQIQKGKK